MSSIEGIGIESICGKCKRVLAGPEVGNEICTDCEEADRLGKPNILFWDLEITPMLVAVYDLKTNYINPGNIVWDQWLISGAWAFNDEEPQVATVGKDYRCDKSLVKTLNDVLMKADLIVGHNGDRFDLKKFRWRAAFHGMPPLPKISTVDTLKVSRQLFGPPSHRLGYLVDRLGSTQKGGITQKQWLKFFLEGDRDTLNEIAEYNKQDIVTLRDLYHKIKPYMHNHPHMKAYYAKGKGDVVCQTCGSSNLIKKGTRKTNSGVRYQRHKCNDCGGWTPGRRIK